MFSLFGVLLVISFCDLNFVNKHFLFLKTVTGKGFFNIFLASMFLVGQSGIWGIMMCVAFGTIGIFFVAIGCACVEGYDNSDLKRSEMKSNAKNAYNNSKTGD